MGHVDGHPDPIPYESRSRTLRLHGVVTSIRVENLVWDVLAELAARQGVTTNHLVEELHDEMLDRLGEASNFASFLRITSLRYLRLESGNRAPSRAAPPVLRRVGQM